MKINELYELIINKDQETEQYIADKLISEINNQPSILNYKLRFKARDKFLSGLTILHLCVLKNMTLVVTELLKNSYVQLTALYPDEEDNNLIHYAVKYNCSEQLLQLLIKRLPDLIIMKNNKGRTPCHVAILENQTCALADLIKSNTLFLNSNKKGNTLLHYAIMRESSVEILEIIIKYFPEEIINQKNDKGDTALHMAVKLNQEPAVKCLIGSGKVYTHIKNGLGLTVFDLAKHDRNLKVALLHIDLEKLQESDIRAKGDRSGKAYSELQDTFPLLSTPGKLSPLIISEATQEFISHEDEKESSGILARQVLELFEMLQDCPPEIDVHSKLKNKFRKFCLKMDLECVHGLVKLISETSKTSSLLHSYLIEETFSLLQQEAASSRLYAKLIKQYAILCHNFDLNNCLPVKEQLTKSSKTCEIYSALLGELKPLLEEHFSKVQDLAKKIFLQLTFHIREQQIIDGSNSYFMPDFQVVDSKGKGKEKGKEKEVEKKPRSLNLLQIMWLITAGQDALEAPRSIDLQKITHIILGIQSLYSFKDILNALKELYPLFDKHQKLVGIYTACHLLISNAQEPSENTRGMTRYFRSFIQTIHSTKKEIRSRAGKTKKDKQSNSERLWSLRLTNLIEIYESFQSLRNNYYLIRSCMHSQSLEANLESFDKLVNIALTMESTERSGEIVKIASAIVKNNVLFYQKVGICEFYDKNWEKKEHPEFAPNIHAQTAHFNALANYFIEKILDQPPENRTNAVKLVVQLAQALCSLENSSSTCNGYPDLTGLFIMASVLNSANISRLTPFFEQLTLEEQDIIEEINLVIAQKSNSRYLRLISSKHPASLPFVGMFQTDMTFTIDGNPEDIFNMLELLGKTLLKILQTKVLVYSKVIIHETDLPLFLSKKNTKSKETGNEDDPEQTKLDDKSRRIIPKEKDFVELTSFKKPLKKDFISFFKEFNECLDKLEIDFLSVNILPQVLIEEKMYVSHYLAQKLFLIFNEKIQSIVGKKSFRKLTKIPDEIGCAINKLDQTLVKIVSVHNNHYYPVYSPKKLNALVCTSQMDHLKESVNKLEDLIKKEQEKKESERKITLKSLSKILFLGGEHSPKFMSDSSDKDIRTRFSGSLN